MNLKDMRKREREFCDILLVKTYKKIFIIKFKHIKNIFYKIYIFQKINFYSKLIIQNILS